MSSLRSGRWLTAKRYSLTEVAKLLHVHPSTVWRWKLRGVRGHRLQTVVIGGTRYVLEADLNKFLVAMNDGVVPLDDDHDARATVAAAQLDALGVKGGQDV